MGEMQRVPSFKGTFKGRPAIIATMGLPCSTKSLVAEKIGKWANCPVLYIDDFIGDDEDDDDKDNIAAAGSWEEAERLQANVLQRAFTTLFRVASRLISPNKLAVIKSRLCSTFELQQLRKLVRNNRFDAQARDIGCLVLIVECEMRSKHQWQHQFNGNDYDYMEYERKWYRPRSWNDIEKARDDHYDAQARADWDLHLLDLIRRYPDALIRRLVVDPFNDLNLTQPWQELNPIFCHAINYLLGAGQEELNYQNPHVVQFDEFRRSRADQILKAWPSSSTRSKDVCGVDGCFFKYRQELPVDEGGRCCGVCEGRVVSEPAYTCYFCILTLHKSCAEMIHFNFLNICTKYLGTLKLYIRYDSEKKHPCKACTEKGLDFVMNCDSCVFQTLLKGRLAPLVVNHDHHPHPLSIRIQNTAFVCKACGTDDWNSSYVCTICGCCYHIQCVFMPKEAEHRHGGHDHVLELKYSQDDKEEEDYWCDVCYEDMDPYFWFYSCQSCPSYAAHLYCAGVYPRSLW